MVYRLWFMAGEFRSRRSFFGTRSVSLCFPPLRLRRSSDVRRGRLTYIREALGQASRVRTLPSGARDFLIGPLVRHFNKFQFSAQRSDMRISR
jgi:hypothetical protein